MSTCSHRITSLRVDFVNLGVLTKDHCGGQPEVDDAPDAEGEPSRSERHLILVGEVAG